ncbi:hypothetical protein ATN84_08935 [Paramesorhizobium deserti]|uniref:DUF3828 domain-containing protein n=1 Tax=Paramesorhizobium deserti TaxID=1494590 RepID=A0A135HWB5_9HYPH|nr:hypothetical protein [Paramesorhizobium deserti]KXF77487.1 hypothetical protein ATN84_08935 [Paramesorhizobium deserti]
MKFCKSFMMIMFTSLIATGAAHAETPPKKSRDFRGNYETLVKDQHASPEMAECIATGYDLVKKSKKFDRLGFTQEDIGKAKVDRKPGKFSARDHTKVSTVIAVSGEARPRTDSTNWADITLRCGISKKGKVKAIEIKTSAD